MMQPKVLVIDEVGYLQLDKLQASLLFQVICHRYERIKPIVLTSNNAFADDSIMASAALDRLLHRSTFINIKRKSYRLKHKRAAGSFNKTPAKPALENTPLSKETPHYQIQHTGGSILRAP